LGHTIEPLAPSLFTFNIRDPRLAEIPGVAVAHANASVPALKLSETGPILITHWGLSGPAILRLSAWGARELQSLDYRFKVRINWAGSQKPEQIRAELQAQRGPHPRRQISNTPIASIPQRLWEKLVEAAAIPVTTTWSSLSNSATQALAEQIGAGEFAVEGKSTNKDEFVTCGGVRLREVDFHTMESRIRPGLHFAGEVLDIDGITGGFNFQAAWTTGILAGRAMAGVGSNV
ncbi:MAG TPA: aminoacetone oxidase family FAD-binding enzyme, partial [Opitutaceae bacterium]